LRAIISGGDSTVLAILGNALALAGDVETADMVTRKALALDGSSAWAWSRSGLIDVYKERAESAIERLFIALDLAPDDPLALNSFMGLGLAHFDADRYVEAVHWFQRAIAEHPSAVWAHLCLCPAYVSCGRKAEAQQPCQFAAPVSGADDFKGYCGLLFFNAASPRSDLERS
jgi:Flp pilus assembly protein TadD